MSLLSLQTYQEQDAIRVALSGDLKHPVRQDASVLAIDDALKSLEKVDPRKARVVELRFFGGLSVTETAETLGISAPTVMRDWSSAKAWLYRELSGG